MPTVYTQHGAPTVVMYDDVDHTIGLSENCCCDDCGKKFADADYSFEYGGSSTCHFEGSGSVRVDASDGTGGRTESVLVHVTCGEFDCDPDAPVFLSLDVSYDLDADSWTVTASVVMSDHQTVCGPGSFPPDTIGSGGSATIPGATGGSTFIGLDHVSNWTGGINVTIFATPPCPGPCKRVTTIQTAYTENHYHYPCNALEGCTPDFGDRSIAQDYTTIQHYDADGALVLVECSGGRSNSCSGGYGCECPPNTDHQCLWNGSCNGSWVDSGFGYCRLDESGCIPMSCTNCGSLACQCYPCPEWMISCTPNDCDDGEDCSWSHPTEGGDGYCYGSHGFCNNTITEFVACE